MQSLKEIIQKIGDQRSFLESKFFVKSLGIFGSITRNETNSNSDIDILVEFSKPIGLFDFIRLEEYLKDLLQVKVDLVPLDGIKPAFKDNINKEVVYV